MSYSSQQTAMSHNISYSNQQTAMSYSNQKKAMSYGNQQSKSTVQTNQFKTTFCHSLSDRQINSRLTFATHYLTDKSIQDYLLPLII